MRQHQALEALMGPIVDGLGFKWIGLQYVPQGKRVLIRLYIDKPGGVTIDDCSLVSRQINAALSVEEELVKGEYILEVSSPGIDRVLFTSAQCAEQIGKLVNIRLIAPLEGQRNFKGRLLRVEDEKLNILKEGGEEVTFAFKDVAEARVVPEW